MHCHTVEQRLFRLGHAWVAIGNALLHLIVPDVPVDPVAIQNTTARLQQKEYDRISSEIHLHRLLEGITSGNNDNFILSLLHRRLSAAVQGKMNAIGVAGRDDVTQLHTYWAEVWQFRNQVISDSKISSLLHAFATSNEAAMQREQVLQESITGFHQRLDAVYPEFSDLSVLLKLAVSQLRLGLRIIAKANSINVEAARTIKAFVDYPSILERSDGPLGFKQSTLAAFDSIYQNLVGIELQASTKVKLRDLLPRLERLYDQALGLWLIDKAREAEADAASQSLYRGSVIEHNMMTDAEIEEQEFLTLFPSFEEPLSGKRDLIAQKSRRNQHLTDKNVAQISRFHIDLFSFSTPLQDGLKLVDQARKQLLSEILGSLLHELPDWLDTSALVYRLRFVNEARSDIQTPAERRPSYNFYRDPNLLELKNATKVITSMQTFLRNVLEEWPEQMVLQHLIDRCDVILTFSLKSPVAKVLSALEQLLLQTDDWEMYANRDNSLSSHRQAITELIVRWRRLELNCWSGLLEFEAKVFAEGASEWWFRLHNAITRGLLDAMNSSEEGSYLEKLIPLIDEFISLSPIGQFDFRIQLLRSFEVYLFELIPLKDGLEEQSLGRVVRIIHSTLQYYRLYHSDLQSYLTEQRAALDKEIQGFIKLASWKDINVQALKQSAQKTHHQLYKIVRKFREVLRGPISPRLKTRFFMVPEVQSLPKRRLSLVSRFQSHINVGMAVSATGPLSNLGSAFKKFENVVGTRILAFISRQVDNEADDLAVSIVSTSKELSEIPIPTNLSPEKRTKFLKFLLVRKRKAFSDLLKELKKCGLSGNVKPDVLRQNSDILWVREQPILISAFPELDVEKGETYFSKLLATLPELRASLSNHHSDLQTRELHRGLSYLESGFSMAVDLRAR
jgi:midasin